MQKILILLIIGGSSFTVGSYLGSSNWASSVGASSWSGLRRSWPNSSEWTTGTSNSWPRAYTKSISSTSTWPSNLGLGWPGATARDGWKNGRGSGSDAFSVFARLKLNALSSLKSSGDWKSGGIGGGWRNIRNPSWATSSSGWAW